MSDRICKVVNVMLENPSDIREPTKVGDEYYFSFRGYIFSCLKMAAVMGGGGFKLYVYPKEKGLARLIAEIEHGYPEGSVDMKEYSSTFVPGLDKLYSTLEESHLGLDSIYDDILGQPDEPPPGPRMEF